MVDSTERHREFVACFAAERARLHIAKMVRVRRLTTAHKAGLLRNKSDVVLVPDSTWFRQSEPALVVGSDLFVWLRCMWPELQRGLDGPAGISGTSTDAVVLLSIVAILVAKASSTRRASAAVKLFLALRIRWAQVVAASGVVRVSSSDRNRSQSASDLPGSRVALTGGGRVLPRRAGLGEPRLGSYGASLQALPVKPVVQLHLRAERGRWEVQAVLTTSMNALMRPRRPSFSESATDTTKKKRLMR